jgi:hypothetical protein
VLNLIYCKDTVLTNIILTGDFNVPDINWDNMSIRNNSNYSLQLNNTMIDFVNANYLTPPAPSLLSFLLTISYPEFSGKIAVTDGII